MKQIKEDKIFSLLKYLKNYATLIALLVMVLLISLFDSSFFTPRNLSNLTRQITVVGIIAIGMTMVIIIKGIDLSVGSIVGLSAVIVTYLMYYYNLSIWVSVIVTIAVSGILVGLWNGFWIAYYKIPSFIITLGMMTIVKGLALKISNGSSIPVTNESFTQIGSAYISPRLSLVVLGICFAFYLYSLVNNIRQKKIYAIEIKLADEILTFLITVIGFVLCLYIFVGYKGIPVPVAIFAVIVISGTFVLKNTKFGRKLYAIGGNEEAARLSGINLMTTRMIVFCIVAVTASISGILIASRLNGGSPNYGDMYGFDAIAAVVIGGTSLSGGSGSILGTVIGIFIIGTLNNGMSLMGIELRDQMIINGLIITLAIWFDVLNKGKKI